MDEKQWKGENKFYAQALDVWINCFPLNTCIYICLKPVLMGKIVTFSFVEKGGGGGGGGSTAKKEVRTSSEYTYLRGENKFSEIQLCGKTGINREKEGPDVECLWFCVDTMIMLDIFISLYNEESLKLDCNINTHFSFDVFMQ